VILTTGAKDLMTSSTQNSRIGAETSEKKISGEDVI
jgi:hypothetical protein